MGRTFWERLAVVVVITGLGAGLGACSLTEDERDEMAEQVYDRNWVVSQIEGVPTAPGVTSTLTIADDGKVSGNAGCNGYFGSVIVDDSAMTFGNLGSTRRACPEPAMGQEDRMLRALDSTRGYRLEQQDLVLLDESGRMVLRFIPGDAV